MKNMEKFNFEQIAEELWDNLLWENMELVIYNVGDTWIRQQGAQGQDEGDIILKINLSPSYWMDSYAVMIDENDDLVKDEEEKDSFIMDEAENIKEAIYYL